MKLGMCIPADRNLLIESKKAGFDYAEMKLFELTNMDSRQIRELRKISDEEGIPVLVCNFFCPGTVRLCNPDFSRKTLIDYSLHAFECAYQMGTGVVVVGSKKSRNIPDNCNREKAEEELVESFRLLGEIAKSYNVTIAIEPLNRMESNVINTVNDGATFCRRVDHQNVRLLADLYHMTLEKEDLECIFENRDILVHTHICSVREDNGRELPRYNDNMDYPKIVAALGKAGYQGTMSIEVFNTDIQKDAAASLDTLRKYFF